jgi:hypothetical protein
MSTNPKEEQEKATAAAMQYLAQMILAAIGAMAFPCLAWATNFEGFVWLSGICLGYVLFSKGPTP